MGRTIKAVPSASAEHKPHSVQKRARLDERTVQKVADQPVKRRARRAESRPRVGQVQHGRKHPALVMAHALGIPESHVQITGEGVWSCVLWNHPAPWPGESHD